MGEIIFKQNAGTPRMFARIAAKARDAQPIRLPPICRAASGTNRVRCTHSRPDTQIVKFGGPGWIRTSEGESQRSYSPPHLAALEPTHIR